MTGEKARLEGRIFRSIAGSGLRIRHQHSEVEFNFVTKGTGAYTINGVRHELRPASVIWLLPNQLHELERDPALEFWSVLASEYLIGDDFISRIGNNLVRTVTSANALALEQVLTLVSQDTDQPAMFNAGVRYAFFRALEGGTQDIHNDSPVHPAVSRALLMLESHTGPGSLEELSHACDVTPTYLSRLLKEHTGHGFVELRNQSRLKRFVKIYRSNGEILASVSPAGFGSYAQFYRVFRATMGMTPTAWAEDHCRVDLSRSDTPLPQDFESLDRSEVRWYRLAGISLSASIEAVDHAFLASLSASHPNDYDVISTASSPEASALNQKEFAVELSKRSPDLGIEFEQLVQSHCVLDTYKWLVALYEGDANDLAAAITSYLMTALIAVHCLGDLSQQQAQTLRLKVCAALRASGPTMLADARERQRTAEAFIHQSIITYHAILAARGSDNPWLLRHLSELANRAAKEVFKRSLRDFVLGEDGTLSRRPSTQGIAKERARL